jgi:uncharacterized YccA/Bax inhibitor family protein
MTRNRCQSLTRSRWFMPAFCVCLGGVVLLAGWLGGQLVSGLIGLAVMACFGLFIALASGSETIRGLRGDGRDERFALIDLRATAVTGQVLIVAVIVGWLVEIARGHSGNPYEWLGALGGLAYALAVAFFRWRG